MKAAVSDGKGKIWVQDVPAPEPGDYECLCRIEACASCTGTDKRLIRGQMSWATPDTYPAVLGHESFGTVVEVGKKVRGIRVGDRFLRPAAWYAGTVRDGLCSWMGGYAEFGVVTDLPALLADTPDAKYNGYIRYQQRIPDDVELDAADATMLVTLKEIYSFVRALGIGSGSKVAVLGAGAVGASMCYFAKLAGARTVIAAARRDAPLRVCRQAGADFTVNTATTAPAEALREYSEGGVDFVLDAAGSADLLISASKALNWNGALCTYAINPEFNARFSEIRADGKWSYIHCPPAEDTAHDQLMALARMKAIPFSLFYSHRMPLERITDGFSMIFNGEASKIVFETV